MALDLGELSIALALDNTKFKADLAATKRDLEGIPTVAQREVRKVSRTFEEEGRKSGGKLSEGINQGLIRNSPLIAAGITGALAAGAPLLLAGATTAFAGVAAAALSQNAEIRESYRNLWQNVRAEAISDAGVLEETFLRSSNRIGAGFEELRPQIQSAFAAVGPQVDSLTGGILDLAHNAMPGLVEAVQAAGPVMDAMGGFLGDVGTGAGEMFSTLAEHGPEAAEAFTALGRILTTLLPVMGDLLGNGVELASQVLPPIATALEAVAGALHSVAPILPAVAAGFAALKITGAISNGLGGLSGRLDTLAGKNLPGVSGAAGRLSTGLSRMGSALPAVGIGAGILGAAFSEAEQKTDDWARALLEGGNAAAQAQQQIQASIPEVTGFWSGVWSSVGNVNNIGGALQTHAALGAADAADKMTAAMTPLQRAQQDVARETNNVAKAQSDYGEDSGHAYAASILLRDAQERLANEQHNLDVATRSATDALVLQAQQALGSASADLALRQARLGVEQAQTRLNDVMKDGKATAEDRAAAELSLEGAYYSAGQAAAAKAMADNAGKTETEQNAAAVQAQLTVLKEMAKAAGGEVPAGVLELIHSLEASAGTAVMSTAKMKDLGLSVVGIPNSKYVDVKAPTGPQMEAMRALGLRIEQLPDGNVRVYADDGPARTALSGIVRDYQNRVIYMKAMVSGQQATGHAYSPAGIGGGRAYGGYTGDGGKFEPAGTVHRGEFVFTKEETAAMGVGNLYALAKSLRGYANGGAVATPSMSAAPAATHVRVYIGDRELTDIVRVESDRSTAGAFTAYAQQMAY